MPNLGNRVVGSDIPWWVSGPINPPGGYDVYPFFASEAPKNMSPNLYIVRTRTGGETFTFARNKNNGDVYIKHGLVGPDGIHNLTRVGRDKVHIFNRSKETGGKAMRDASTNIRERLGINIKVVQDARSAMTDGAMLRHVDVVASAANGNAAAARALAGQVKGGMPGTNWAQVTTALNRVGVDLAALRLAAVNLGDIARTNLTLANNISLKGLSAPARAAVIAARQAGNVAVDATQNALNLTEHAVRLTANAAELTTRAAAAKAEAVTKEALRQAEALAKRALKATEAAMKATARAAEATVKAGLKTAEAAVKTAGAIAAAALSGMSGGK